MVFLRILPAGLCVMAALLLGGVAVAATVNTTSTLRDTPIAPELAEQPTQFVLGIDDLTLMPGLTQLSDAETIFVVPKQGRIADSSAAGAVDVDDVYRFYRRSLPQLGWKALDARSFKREGESLTIAAHSDGKITTVRFTLKPE